MSLRRSLVFILLAASVHALAAERSPRQTPEAGPLEKRVPVAPPGTPVWVVGSGTADLNVTRNERGEIFLAPGKSLILIDPSEPSLQVEVKARDDEPLYLGSIMALSRLRGIYAGLAGQRGQMNAGTAVEGPNGVIVFKMDPATPLERRPVVATAPRAAAAIKDEPESVAAPVTAAPPIASSKPAPPAPVVVESLVAQPPVAAPAEKVAVLAPVETAAQPAQAAPGRITHENAMRALLLRQGGGVRSVSELTQVHPAVDRLRRMQ